MASGVEELLDMLFEMIDEAKNAAFSNDKCIIERDRVATSSFSKSWRR